ncbi:MAG: endolytic transglycosylase MltG [Alphaproteobacteria bacterium]|nr:endolytic transglycosylase MltG [Alphaproteobacteria bacterium]
MRHTVVFYFLIIFIVVGIMGGSVLSTYSQFVAEGPLESEKTILIEAGRSVRKIAKQLYREGIINSPAVFEIGVRASGNTMNIKAGEYSIPKRSSSKTVMNILTSGKTYIRKFVVPEGLTSIQIVELMDGMYGLMGEIEKIPPNGTLMPDTYWYSYGDSKQDLLIYMQNSMKRTLDELWATKSKTLSFKTPEEAVVMASIVEKETAKDSERSHIAAVFHNRLAKKMKLQSDPTVIFAVTQERGELKRKLTYSDLRVQHPSNTYVIAGLPDKPICNPGKTALQAVLNPDSSQDLYFVADGKGGHIFAKTYAEHEQNVAAYRKFMNAQRLQ